MKKRKYEHKGLSFDSKQEIQCFQWLSQLKYQGAIEDFVYQPQSFMLSQPVSFNKKSLLRGHVYTPDFTVDNPNQKLMKDLFIYTEGFDTHYIQIKPGFDRFHDATKFVVNQKWVFSRYGIYVYKFEVESLFLKTFVPEYSRYTEKTRKLRDKYKHTPNVKQYLHT